MIIQPHSYWPDCNWCASSKRRRNRLDDFTPHDMASPPLLTPPADRRHVVRRGGTEGLLWIPEVGDEDVVPASFRSPPTEVLGSLPVIPGGSTGTPTATTAMDNIMTGAPDPALAKAKTMRAAPCSTSPTKSMPPSASKSLELPRSVDIVLKSDWCHDSMDVLSV